MPSTTAAGTGLALSAGVPATQTADGYTALTYTEVSNVESLGGFGASTEVTSFQPLRGPQQKHKGPTNFGALNPTIALDDADAGQALLAAASAPDNRALYAARVTKPDGSLRFFQVRVFGMPETIGAANSMITAAPVLEINTPVVKVAANAPPAPSFTVQPSISPTSGSVGTTFTASDGTALNAASYTRRWLLGTTAIGTGTTVTPNAAGSLTLEVTATGAGGSKVATSSAVTVAAAPTPTPSPAPAPISGLTSANTAKIRAAMAASRNAIISAVGPSTTGGLTQNGGTAQAVNSWPMQTAALLQAAGVNAGAGNFFGDKAGWGAGSQTAATFMAGDGRVVLTGSAAPTSFITAGGNGFGMNGAAGTIEFTPQIGVTEFAIYYRDAVGQDWSWSIDGGAATVVSGKAGTGAPAKLIVSAGAAGTHKLTISWVAGNARFVGVSAYNNASSRKEMTFLNWGVPGARSAQLIEDVDGQASRLKTWTALAPDLTIIDDFAINDWRQSVTIDTFKANLLAAINKGKETGDVVVTTPLWDASTTGNAANQNDYATATVDVATAAGVPIIDIRSAWKSYADANAAGWYSDSVHPTQAGYRAKADAIVYFIQQVRALA